MAHLLDEEPSNLDVCNAWATATQTGLAQAAVDARKAMPGWSHDEEEDIRCQGAEQYNTALVSVMEKCSSVMSDERAWYEAERAALNVALSMDQTEEARAKLLEKQQYLDNLGKCLENYEQIEQRRRATVTSPTHTLDNTQLMGLLESGEIQQAAELHGLEKMLLVTAHSSAGVVYPDSIPDNACLWEKQKERGDVIDAGERMMRRVSVCCHCCCCFAYSLLLMFCFACIDAVQMSSKKKQTKQPAKQRDESEDEVSEPEIEELENRGEVTKAGTAGTKRAAVAGDAITKLAVVIDKMKAGGRKNDIINAFNKVCIGYDQVILSYVGKRDALKSANDVIATLRDTVATMEKGAAETVEKVLAQRRGCSCRVATQAGSMAGRCVTCACAKANAKCSKVLYGCRCGDDCTRRESKQKEVDSIVKKRFGIMKKKDPSLEEALAKLGLGVLGVKDDEDDDDDDEDASASESSSEEEEHKSAAAAAPKKKKNGKASPASSKASSRSASKKKDSDDSDSEEEEQKQKKKASSSKKK